MEHIDYLKSLDACEEAIKFAERFDTLQSAWNSCERGDWMLWLISRTMDRSGESQLRKLTLAKARCAKLVIHLMRDERSRNAVAVAEQFGLGNATRQELDSAAAYAAAAAAADAYAAAYAAYAAAYAADANAANAANAYAAAYANAEAANAAYAAANAADANAADANAADAAAYAAYAAYANANAAAYAANANAAAYANAAKRNILKQCADIVRGLYKDVELAK